LQCILVLNTQVSTTLQQSPNKLNFELLNRPIADKNCKEIMKQLWRSLKNLHKSKRQSVKHLFRYTDRN